MDEIKSIEQSRRRILKEIGEIRVMRKGSVMEQYLEVAHKGKKEPVLRGPYWLYTKKEKGKTVSQRLRRNEAERYEKEVEAFHRFQSLCDEYAELTERLGELERELDEGSREKKRRRSPSRRTRR
jgi:hypothetical protein